MEKRGDLLIFFQATFGFDLLLDVADLYCIAEQQERKRVIDCLCHNKYYVPGGGP